MGNSYKLDKKELQSFLDEKYTLYHQRSFIDSDPILIAKEFTKREDVEIVGFLVSLFSWGKRAMIIRNGHQLLNCMDKDPHNFIVNASQQELTRCLKFVHRTMNGEDMVSLILALRKVYQNFPNLEDAYLASFEPAKETFNGIVGLRNFLAENIETTHTLKHLSNPAKGSAAKRINMFLRWMVRQNSAVDFGIWKKIPTESLMLPLDVHTGRVGRKLGLLKRKQDDWKAVVEITQSLRELDSDDPIKYDYALFGLGVFEDF